MGRLREIWEVAAETPSRRDAGFELYLAQGWARKLGDVAPRIAIREFVSVLDRVHDHETFDPYTHYTFAVPATDLRDEERAVPAASPDDEF